MTGSNRPPSAPLWWIAGLLLAPAAAAQNSGFTGAPAAPNIPGASYPSVTFNTPSSPSPQAASPVGPLPRATLHFDTLSGGANDARLDGVHLDYNTELKMDADHLRGDLEQSRYDATGHVFAHERDTTLRADHLHVNGLSGLGFSEHAFLSRRPYTLRAARIDFQPGKLVATRADVTTANPADTNPNIGLVADTMTLTPVVSRKGVVDPRRENVDMRNAKLYLFHNRIITLRDYKTVIGNDPKTNQPTSRPTFGYSTLYGFFAGYNGYTSVDRVPLNYSAVLPQQRAVQLRLNSQQVIGTALAPRVAGPPPSPAPPVTPSLAALRVLTTAPRPPLPDGDPLLFHDFLPDTNPIQLFNGPPPAFLVAAEEVSSHVETIDGRNGNVAIYVSRLPDINLYNAVPLGHVYQLPTSGDPVAFRRALRRLAVYAGVNGEVERIREEAVLDNRYSPPPDSATRETYAFHLSTQPLLVAPNTVIVPGYVYGVNHYVNVNSPLPGRQFDYNQYSIAVQHYFSNYSGVGVQYYDNQSRGDTPLNFDVFGASRELDGRLQVGDRKLAIAGSFRYDLLNHNVIDYTVAVAPGLRGFTPVFSYRFFSKTYGVSLAIPGLTF